MEFKRYMSLKRLGREGVENIDIGKCYVFPKIDGTNSSVWYNSDTGMEAGSRNRLLNETSDGDNAGFCKWVKSQKNIEEFLKQYPNLRLYGEWLVPHTLKTYEEDAWNNLYVFDVYNDETNKFIPYEKYKDLLEMYNIEYIPPLAIINNPSEDQLIHIMNENNTYLIKNGQGVGEGIVIKNYEYTNNSGKVVWAKMVTNEFKEQHRKCMGISEVNKPILEESIISIFCTESFIEKEYSKICLMLENKGEHFKRNHIPMLFNIIYSEFIKEEMINILNEFNNPIINFRRLNGLCILKIKTTLKEVF